MLGTGLSQFIPVIFSFWLARIYLPEDFGHLAIFMALSVIIGMAASGMYEYAIVLPEDEGKAENVVRLIALIGVAVCLFISLILIAVHYFGKNVESYYLFLPLSIFCTMCTNVLSYWFNRHRYYRRLNLVRIISAVLIVVGSFAFMRLKHGLIYGYVMGGVFNLAIFLVLFSRLFRSVDAVYIKLVAKEYRNFPKVMLPSSLVNTAGSYAPVFFIKRFYTSAQLGSYSMSTRVLTAPISIISTAIGQIYFRNLTEYYNQEDFAKMRSTFYKSSMALAGMAACIFLPLFFFGEELMIFAFGKNWKEAGEIIEIVAIASIVKFIASPLSTILVVMKKMNTVAIWQVVYFCTTIIIWFIGSRYDLKTLLWIYVVHESILYGVYYFLMRKSLL